jgi:hypothetical protein
MATKRQEAFRAQVEQRLAPLSYGSPEYVAELERLHTDRDAGIAADIAEENQRQKAQIAQMQARATRLRAQSEARALVRPLAHDDLCTDVLVPHVLPRVSVEGDDDDSPVLYRDANGNPTTAAAVQEEIRNNPAFSRLVIGASPAEKAERARLAAVALGAAPPGKRKL